MIQRVQTLFLLAVVICVITSALMPIWHRIDGGAKTELGSVNINHYNLSAADDTSWELNGQEPIYYIAVLLIAAGVSALYSIFQYKNRMRQIQIGAITALLIMGSVIAMTYNIHTLSGGLSSANRGVFGIGYFAPVVALVLNSLANRFIKKDEKLVRSVDRIR